jgi:hypothetical protein
MPTSTVRRRYSNRHRQCLGRLHSRLTPQRYLIIPALLLPLSLLLIRHSAMLSLAVSAIGLVNGDRAGHRLRHLNLFRHFHTVSWGSRTG